MDGTSCFSCATPSDMRPVRQSTHVLGFGARLCFLNRSSVCRRNGCLVLPDRWCVMTSVNGAFDSHIPSKLARQKRSRPRLVLLLLVFTSFDQLTNRP